MNEPVYFQSPEKLRAWFAEHHASKSELIVGFYKKGSGEPSITWPESVDEALCVGWIDGVRKSVDDRRYTIRFTRRKAGSTWSAVNIQRMKVLAAEGRMKPEGMRAFDARSESKSRIYAYEQVAAELCEPYLSRFRSHEEAWRFFQAQAASYKKTVIWRILSAKREGTRDSRLQILIDASAEGRRIL